jgi:hypothetical protein
MSRNTDIKVIIHNIHITFIQLYYKSDAGLRVASLQYPNTSIIKYVFLE